MLQDRHIERKKDRHLDILTTYALRAVAVKVWGYECYEEEIESTFANKDEYERLVREKAPLG